ncbi:hypothetical protein GGS21DRAFT_35017 [Xylaria nigripes]|nr:hypothetical protein GGS21DRAFT_35017 [Xylaria nigripes]
MKLTNAMALLSLAAMGAAEDDLEIDDVSSACFSPCQFIIDLSTRCDRANNDDNEYLSCVCKTTDAETHLTECATCIKDNGRSDSDDNDVSDLMSDCGWDFNTASSNTASALHTTGTTMSSSATPTGIVTMSQTQIQTSTTGTESPREISTTASSTGTGSPVATGDSMAGASTAKAVIAPLLAGLAVGVLHIII